MAHVRTDFLAELTICDCFSAYKLPFRKKTFAFIKGFTDPVTASKRLNKLLNLVSSSLILLTWLTLEVVHEVVHYPSSSEYFNWLKVGPQMTEQILDTIWRVLVLHSFTRTEYTFVQPHQKFTCPSFWCPCIGHKETKPSLVLSEICSFK